MKCSEVIEILGAAGSWKPAPVIGIIRGCWQDAVIKR